MDSACAILFKRPPQTLHFFTPAFPLLSSLAPHQLYPSRPSSMEALNAYTTSSEQIQASDAFRPRQLPDVPEDVDFLMEHLNDPNYDLKQPPSVHSHLHDFKEKKYQHYDVDGESQYDSDRYSTERAESRISTAIDFDE